MSTAKLPQPDKITLGSLLTSFENKLSNLQKIIIGITFLVTTIIAGINFFSNQSKGTQQILTELRLIKKDVGFISARQDSQMENAYWWRSDSTGGTIDVGVALCNLLGRQKDELTQAKWMNEIPYSEKKAIQEEFDNAKRYKRDFNINYHYLTRDSAVIYVNARAKYAGQDWYGTITVLEDPRRK